MIDTARSSTHKAESWPPRLWRSWGGSVLACNMRAMIKAVTDGKRSLAAGQGLWTAENGHGL